MNSAQLLLEVQSLLVRLLPNQTIVNFISAQQFLYFFLVKRVLFLCQCQIEIGTFSVQGDLVSEELHCFLSHGMNYHVKFDGLSDDLFIDVADVDFELVVKDLLTELVGESQAL